MESSDTEFEAEVETLAAHLSEWLDAGYEGMWVAIRGRECTRPFPSFADAWGAGVAQLGAEGLIVEKIERECRPLLFSNLRWSS
jgi:hypothetical protein